MEEMMKEYFNTKDIPKRNKILKELVFTCPPNAKDFFTKYLKKKDIWI